MQKAFVTAESGYGKYCLVFKFRTLGDLQAAHKEWVTQPAAQPAADQRCMNPRLWTKEMSDAWHSNIPDLQKAFDALLSAGKETHYRKAVNVEAEIYPNSVDDMPAGKAGE
jgi:hypothetical protein